MQTAAAHDRTAGARARMASPGGTAPHHVVIFGTGFGGAPTPRAPAGMTARVTLIDRTWRLVRLEGAVLPMLPVSGRDP